MIEGPRAVLETLASSLAVEDVFVTEDLSQRSDIEAAAGSRSIVVTEKVLRAMSDTDSPQGVVAVATRPGIDLRSAVDRATLVLVLAGVRDPGNAGTLLRSAMAAGADAVVFTDESVDPFGPKTVRASAGAIARLPIVEEPHLDAVVQALHEAGLRVLATEASGPPAYELDLAAPVAFVLGNEAWGLPAGSQDAMDGRVGIPMPGPVESLNVGIAGSLLLFEALRQRRD